MNVLTAVLSQDAYAALSLDEHLERARIPLVDRRLCASIVYTTLENLIRIDYALDKYLKDAASLDGRARNLLRLGACQILFHDRVPDSAAVNETVKLARDLGLEGLCGLVNGTLRNLSRGKETLEYPKADEGARYLSVMRSLPLWLAETLIADYGEETALLLAQHRPEQYISVRPNALQLTDEQFSQLLEKKVWKARPGVAPRAVRLTGVSNIGSDADFLAGRFSIQGEGSMLAAEAVGASRGMRVLDCCAAPGGKTAYIAERMQNTGRVAAWDIHEHRVELIRAQMRRLRIENARPAVRDATVFREDSEGMYDAVLLDAPCTGLGVMDGKPDIKYRHTRETVSALCAVQKKLLDTCCRYVKPGGTFVYSTCSVLKDENERQIAVFLAAHPEFAINALPSGIPQALREHASENGLQLLPFRDDIEGFFIARMQRKRV